MTKPTLPSSGGSYTRDDKCKLALTTQTKPAMTPAKPTRKTAKNSGGTK